MTGKRTSQSLPESETHYGRNLLGVLAAYGAVLVFRSFYPSVSTGTLILAVLLATALPMMVLELLFNQKLKRRLCRFKFGNIHLERILTKYFGLLGTLCVLMLIYWLFPIYQQDFYQPFIKYFYYSFAFLTVFSLPYIAYVDQCQQDPRDRYWHAGLFFRGRWAEADFKTLGKHTAEYAIKGFFLPLMVTYLGHSTGFLINYDWSRITSFIGFYDYLYNLIFFVDLLFAGAGYILTLRILDTHIRSTEPTTLGWVVALMCYTPFWASVFAPLYFHYDDGHFWGQWLEDDPTLKIIWGSVILFVLAIYSAATVSLGLRFSNLTYRGLVTNGPYRFTKHPAYVFKCISWWLISIPFISQAGFEDGLRNCLMLLGVNFIYYLRAITEENHLSRYPEYVAYGLAMNERSIFAPLARLLPFLRYRPERNINKILLK